MEPRQQSRREEEGLSQGVAVGMEWELVMLPVAGVHVVGT